MEGFACRSGMSAPATCNGCEVEIAGRVPTGIRRGTVRGAIGGHSWHADALLVTGVVTRNMADPLRNTVAATPGPRAVIPLRRCALNRGVFCDAYGVVGAVGEVVPVDVEIPGCPPTPTEIIAAVRSVTGK